MITDFTQHCKLKKVTSAESRLLLHLHCVSLVFLKANNGGSIMTVLSEGCQTAVWKDFDIYG